jgi:hypothetical protein
MRGELTSLGFNFCPIGDNGAEIIAAFMKLDEIVRSVYVRSCNIGPPGIRAIAESLKHNQTLEKLYLYDDQIGNEIGNEGADALIEALNYNVCIKGLFVSPRGIDPELQATIEYLTETRNKILIPAAVRQASLSLIAARRNITNAGILAIFPKEIVRMIAMEVWATRKEPTWINALTESERTGKSDDK